MAFTWLKAVLTRPLLSYILAAANTCTIHSLWFFGIVFSHHVSLLQLAMHKLYSHIQGCVAKRQYIQRQTFKRPTKHISTKNCILSWIMEFDIQGCGCHKLVGIKINQSKVQLLKIQSSQNFRNWNYYVHTYLPT